MPKLMPAPPYSPIEFVAETLHGVSVTDPYRWLEDQQSSQTRGWLTVQQQYARSYLDHVTGRDRIRQRIRELLDVEVFDSILKAGQRYVFRKRLPGQEQPCIFLREGDDHADRLLIDPGERGTGPYTAVRPLRISADGRLLLYEVKEGGERTARFEILEIETRKALPDVLPRGYLRGFAFSPDSQSFYYVHEPLASERRQHRAAYQHFLGTSFNADKEIFADESDRSRLHIVPGREDLAFLVHHFREQIVTDLYLWPMGSECGPKLVVRDAHFKIVPLLLQGNRILAITDCDAPNSRIIELRPRSCGKSEFVDIVPESNAAIQGCLVAGEQVFVSYIRGAQTQIEIFDLSGTRLGQLPVEPSDTVRLLGASANGDEVFVERESFTKPIQICSWSSASSGIRLWAERRVPFASGAFDYTQVWFTVTGGTRIPMFLVGRHDVLEGTECPTIMTAYGGYGVPMTPQFSVFVAFLMERGWLFALPNIRGGLEFGAGWHLAAKRQNRQVAFNDFLSAAEWLITTGRTDRRRLAIFGGSNSGLLVGAAMTQRPDLFRAVVCMVPMLDMLRYHLFDSAHVWKEEFGTADDAEDFAALLGYSPYHNVRDGVKYPAVMIVSGDADQNCNPLHARKMTARLQAASASDHPIILDYSRHRGHSPVLPLSERIEALTDRMAFLCDQLELPV